MTAQDSDDNWMSISERSSGLSQISPRPSITRRCISVSMKIWLKGGLMIGIVARGAATSTFVRTASCTIGQQRGHPGIPLEEYTPENLEHEYHTVKPCAPHCTIPCVQRVAMVDEFRESPREALVRFFPVRRCGDRRSSDMPVAIRVLTWLFLPPIQHNWRNRLSSAFTRTAMLCLRVR